MMKQKLKFAKGNAKLGETPRNENLIAMNRKCIVETESELAALNNAQIPLTNNP